MKVYQKRIRDYQELIQKEYVRDEAVQEVVEWYSDKMIRKEDTRISYFEFLYEQSRFIKKKWWWLQGVVLLLLWLLLRDSDNAGDMGRMTGILATVFVILVIPEVWKNRRYSAVEIEGAAYYPLRQIYAARILLFAFADMAMVTVFFAISLYTIQISAYRMITDFLLPFNVSGCICFRLLYSTRSETEYVAVLASSIWMVIWTAIVMHDEIYQRIVEPVWFGLILLSFCYFIFCIKKSQMSCEKNWEELIDGIRT